MARKEFDSSREEGRVFLKSLCGGGLPSSHPSLRLSVFFLFEGRVAPKGKGSAGGGGVAGPGRGERRDRGEEEVFKNLSLQRGGQEEATGDRRENDESGTTARWHEGCSENRRGTAKGDRKRQTPKG